MVNRLTVYMNTGKRTIRLMMYVNVADRLKELICR